MGHGGEEGEVEVAADDRGQGQDALGVWPEACQAPPDHLPHAHREPHGAQIRTCHPAAIVALINGTGFDQVAHHLTDEERVPGRLAQQCVAKGHALLVHLVAGHAFEERQQIEVGQPAQGDALGATLAVQPGQQIRQGIPGRDIRVAKRPEHADAHGRLGGVQVAQELETRPVGPVQVIEHHEHRMLDRSASEEVGDATEEHEALAVGVF